MKQIAVFASGDGTNTQHLIDYFRESTVNIALIVCNNPKANVIKRAEKNGIPCLLIDKTSFQSEDILLNKISALKIDLIVCAGFLWKIPDYILHAFPNKIINIHPALLPKFGGKGMYGLHVHRAVIEAGEKESGITIHFLNEHYDEGKIILQKKCKVEFNDTAESLAEKIHQMEYEWYPKTIENVITSSSLKGI